MTFKKDSLGYDQFSQVIDFNQSIAQGESPVHTAFHIMGRSAFITTTVSDIVGHGGMIYWPQSAAPIGVVSDSANDANTTTATGCRKLTIEGLLAGFTAVTEVINMNGLTTATTANSFLRINKVYANESGQYSGTTVSSHGTISLSMAGNIMSKLMVENNIAMGEATEAKYTVPKGYSAYLNSMDFHIQVNKECTVYAFQRLNADVVSQPFTPKRVFESFIGLTSSEHAELRVPRKFPEKTDIWFSAISSLGTCGVTVNLEFILKRE